MTDDLPGTIRRLRAAGKIASSTSATCAGRRSSFVETFHDDGPTDMLACMRAYADIGFEGVLRPDHVPTLDGEANDKPGYETLGTAVRRRLHQGPARGRLLARHLGCRPAQRRTR